jgi:hypothetical protein
LAKSVKATFYGAQAAATKSSNPDLAAKPQQEACTFQKLLAPACLYTMKVRDAA